MFKIIANDKNIIPYRKELNLITGGALESIFLAQLLYWYEVNDCNEFYKFREPCDHPLYKEGDSWCEELGFGIKIIDRIIKAFKDKGFLTTRITIDRVTFYSLNIKLINELLESIYENVEVAITKIPKGNFRNCQKGNYETIKRGNSIKNNNYSSRDYSETTSETTSENLTPTPFKNPQELEAKNENEAFKNLNLEAFNKWSKYCEQKGFKIVGIQFDEVKKYLCKFSKEKQEQVISYSIANGYKGLFEPKAKQSHKSGMSDEELDEFFAMQKNNDPVLSNNWLSKGLPEEVKSFNEHLDSSVIPEDFKRKFLIGE